jgi:hypothetical protein
MVGRIKRRFATPLQYLDHGVVIWIGTGGVKYAWLFKNRYAKEADQCSQQHPVKYVPVAEAGVQVPDLIQITQNPVA